MSKQRISGIPRPAGAKSLQDAGQVAAPGANALRPTVQELGKKNGGPERKQKQFRVLVVDDKARECDRVTRKLERQGFCTQSALSGEEALRMLGEESVDAIVLDWQMPGMSGFEVFQRMEGSNREKVVFFTFALDEDREELALRTGRPVVKKSELRDLLGEVRKIIEASEAKEEAGSTQKHARVFIAEDDDQVRRFAVRMCRGKVPPENIGQAKDGKRALRILLEPDSDFDLILLDLFMPGMMGTQVVEELERNGRQDLIDKVVVWSGTTNRDMTPHVLELIKGRMLSKPVKTSILHELLDYANEGRVVDWRP